MFLKSYIIYEFAVNCCIYEELRSKTVLKLKKSLDCGEILSSTFKLFTTKVV